MSAATSDQVFHIECPADVTVECGADLSDLSIFGNAVVYGYGSPTSAGPPESEVFNLNSCGTGTVVRTWVAYDYAGTAYSCSQTIYVGTGGYGSVSIDWPPDYTINSCFPETDPEDLPPPYDFPVINDYGNSCVQIMINYEDLVFDINPPACKKILRKWTVIDWCQYDPNDWYPQGIWEHTQIIKIVPENPPVIICPGDTVITAGADCTGGHVSLNLATGYSDCGAGITITNHSPYAINNGPDASGFYPVGTTKVVFTANDGCGGKSSCSMYVTVQDMKKPTPVCYYGVTVSLMQMPDGYFMDLRPDFFNKGSFDNCTPAEDLIFSVEPSRVSCEHLGETPVKMYVTDASGNSDYCNTVVYVQDNMDICPPTDGVISGVIHTMQGAMLPDIAVSLQNHSSAVMTNDNGEYAFESVAYGQSYTVTPEATTHDMTGVTALDLVVMLKHILGVERFSEPLQYVAADLDGSKYVSVNDLLILKELILKNHHELPAGTSWRFIDDQFEFVDPFEPLSQPIPFGYTIDVLSSDMAGLNFTGIKMGDLSGDAQTTANILQVETRAQGVTIAINDRNVEEGESVEIPVIAKNLQGSTALQLALAVDEELASLVDVKVLELPGSELSSQGLEMLEKGKVSYAWFDVEAAQTESSVIFQMTLQIHASGKLAEMITLDEELMPALSYDAAYEEHTVQFSAVGNGIVPDIEYADDLVVGQNYPNPFTGETTIPVNLAEDSELQIVVVNASGQEILRKNSLRVHAGQQQIVLDKEGDLHNAQGLLFCRISTDRTTKTIRMVTLDEYKE